MRRILLIGITVLASACIFAAEHKEPSKGLLFFYRIGNRVDHYLTQNIDTDYISLPEHSWRIAYTNAMVGVHSTLSSSTVFPDYGEVNFALANRTTPSVDLGFYAGYRGLGFGYSWDALHAYAQRLSFSLGSKFIGIDFNIQTSTNITTNVSYNGDYLWDLGKTDVVITNASLNVWYALNAVRYSHQAAVKQSYIQRKTAGSPLIFLVVYVQPGGFAGLSRNPRGSKTITTGTDVQPDSGPHKADSNRYRIRYQLYSESR